MEKLKRFFKNTIVRRTLFFLLVLLCISVCIWPDFYKTQIKKAASYYWVWKGDRYYKNKKPQKAINCYKKGIAYNPKHYKARYNLANIFVVYEDYFSAMEYYEQALKIKPSFQNARIDYAIVLANAAFNYDDAIREYEKAIRFTPKWVYIPFVINNKSTFKYNQGIAYYNLGLAWRGKSLLVGEKNFESRQYLENAVESYSKALKISKNYSTYYNLALANQLLNNHSEAGKYYCKAIDMEPMNFEAHYNLAILLMNLNKLEESIDELKKAGLLLDTKGDGMKSRYIYNVLNDVTQKMIHNNDYNYLVEHIDTETDILNRDITYVGGKVVVSSDLDRAMVKNFKKCASKKFFEDLDKDEDDEDLRFWR